MKYSISKKNGFIWSSLRWNIPIFEGNRGLFLGIKSLQRSLFIDNQNIPFYPYDEAYFFKSIKAIIPSKLWTLFEQVD